MKKKLFIKTEVNLPFFTFICDISKETVTEQFFVLTVNKKIKLNQEVLFDNNIYTVEEINGSKLKLKFSLTLNSNRNGETVIVESDLVKPVFFDCSLDVIRSKYNNVIGKDIKDGTFVKIAVKYSDILKKLVPVIKDGHAILNKCSQKDDLIKTSKPLYKKLIQKGVFEQIKLLNDREGFVKFLKAL